MPAVQVEPMARRKPNRDPAHVKLRRLFDAKCPGRPLADIAEAAGMKRQALHYLMSGKVESPTLGTIYRILHAVNATLAEFERA